MRFVCDVCQTRYIIPDERARGRVLKVRCKKCGNVILLRPLEEAAPDAAAGSVAPAPSAASAAAPVARASPSVAARAPVSRAAAPQRASVTQPDPVPGRQPEPEDERTQIADAGAMQALREQLREPPVPASPSAPTRAPAPPPQISKEPPEPVEWHVIIAGKQFGPLPLSKLIEKMLAGEMLPRTFVWRDGMGDWKRAEEVPDVSRWLPAQPSPTPGPRAVPAIGPPPEKAKAAKGKAKEAPPAARVEKAKPAKAAAPPQSKKSSVADLFDDESDEKGDGQIASLSQAPVPEESQEVDQFFAGRDVDENQIPAAPVLAADPFSQVGDAPGLEQPKPGEVTRFFITQAGVTKQRSPWRIAAYAGGGLVFLVLVLVALSQLGVPVPLVSSAGDSASRIFSSRSKDAKLKNELLGQPKVAPPVTSTAAPHLATATPTAPSTPSGPVVRKAEQHVDRLAASDKQQLADLYAKQPTVALNLKPSTTAAPVIDRPDAPLTPEQVSKTVEKFRSGYAACVDQELKRNPNFHGGKVRIVTTIMSSGLVRDAKIESDDARLARSVSEGALGGCIRDRTKRMVFPTFQGEAFDAEIPLVLGSAL